MKRPRQLRWRQLAYYRQNFRESIGRDVVYCLECGKPRKALGLHLPLFHDLDASSYRERWGFNRQTPLVAASTAEVFRRLALRRKIGIRGPAAMALIAKARAARRPRDMTKRAEARLQLSEDRKEMYARGWKPRRFMKVDDKTLRKLARRGYALKRIARRTGLSLDRVRVRLQSLGVLPPRRPRQVISRERVLALRRNGWWPLEIARILGVKPQAVRKILWQLRGAGVRIPTPRRPRPIAHRRVSDRRFLAAFAQGETPRDVARRLGVSREYVVRRTWYLRKRGLIPKPVSRRRATTRRRRRGS